MEAQSDITQLEPLVNGLRMEAEVLLARSELSAADVARARREGSLAMAVPEGGKACLELGGVVLAEGRVVTKRGKRVFVVEKAYQSGGKL